MKTLLFTLLLILAGTCLYAQTSKEQKLQAYIKKKGYVPLTDTVNLPESMMRYYKVIMDMITTKHPQMKDFYVLRSSIKNNPITFEVALYPISAIAIVKEYDDINIKNQEDYVRRSKDTSIKNNYLEVEARFTGSAGELELVLTKATNDISLYQGQ